MSIEWMNSDKPKPILWLLIYSAKIRMEWLCWIVVLLPLQSGPRQGQSLWKLGVDFGAEVCQCRTYKRGSAEREGRYKAETERGAGTEGTKGHRGDKDKGAIRDAGTESNGTLVY